MPRGCACEGKKPCSNSPPFIEGLDQGLSHRHLMEQPVFELLYLGVSVNLISTWYLFHPEQDRAFSSVKGAKDDSSSSLCRVIRNWYPPNSSLSPSPHGCQMAIARFLDRMCLALRATGLWLRNATLQNLIPSFPCIAPPHPPPWHKSNFVA